MSIIAGMLDLPRGLCEFLVYVYLIAGVLPPTQGSIWFDGEDVTRFSAAERCQRGIARTFQVVKSF